ncbi:HesA/MoeB/ThiF family protein [Candidatus Igneacidithiobacillus taiwanensis]|uniref:HesA/MoeB/ThiF family protein n=1 Tax=Candidatus Igneacidithiobacillus taiwanensis TaxID=1945924 RepID=UPI00289EDEA9|nr:HesA/MoeB/ThiF family protein [Candidatus Igneacidithiobacillus taiwanensis]MCE5360481.1 HesA/MoeB/ThiF family protein [Acidithiobacillus sp.]
MPPELGDGELLRYARQILLPEVDVAGQQRLAAARVLIIGMGGLGCPAALYLAGAGIGTLGLCDGDTVSRSNLPRQILYNEDDLGRAKAEAAAHHLQAHNSSLQYRVHSQPAAAELLTALLPEYDLVLDCSDNFATRHAINRACWLAGKPLVSAAAIRWSGQLAVFDFRVSGPCYACLYPDLESEDEDRCATLGVIGPLTGMLGSLQALEAIRLLLGQVSPVQGKLLLLDAQTLEFRTIRLVKDPQCPTCSRP